MGTEKLKLIEGMMNSEKYKVKWETCLSRELERVQKVAKPIFQQDSALCHIFKKMLKYINDKKVILLDWPGNSPDLNTIEKLWFICKVRLLKM